MEIRTTADYGVIFWQGQSSDTNLAGEDYVSLGLNDGYLGEFPLRILNN